MLTERQTRQNSRGVAEVTKIHATTWVNFKKVHFLAFLRKAIIKVYFYAKRLKILTFRFLCNKKDNFSAFLRKAIKKGAF